MAFINHAWACRTWLDLLEQGPASALIGKVNKDLLVVAAKYSIFKAYMDYYAEVPLFGEAGVDLSAQYQVKDFLEENLLKDNPLAHFGKMFQQYAGLLKSRVPGALAHCNGFLETDIASGDKEQAALFLNMSGNLVDQLVAEAFRWNGWEERYEAVVKYLHLLQPEIVLWQLGMMFSRQEAPTRLVLASPKDVAEDYLEALNKLGKPEQAEIVAPLLRELDQLKLFSFMLDLDIQQNGTLGDTIGLELLPHPVTPTQQLMMFRTSEWQRALEILHSRAKVDERLELLPTVIASRAMSDNLQPSYYMYSAISHLKLRWQNNEQLPSKAYLLLRTRPLQKFINEIVLG